MEKRSQTKVAMAYGAMYGLAAVVVSLVFYLSGSDIQNRIPQWLSYFLLIIFMVMGIKSYRDRELGGYISYGNSLGTGILIGLFGSFITGFYTVFLFTKIDPSLAQKIIDIGQQRLADQGMSDDQIAMTMTLMRKFMAIILFISTVISAVFISFLLSLIISVFMKREQENPFQTPLQQ